MRMMIIAKMILNLMGEVEKILSFLKGGSTKMNLELNRRKKLKFMLRLDVFPLVSLQALSYTLIVETCILTNQCCLIP